MIADLHIGTGQSELLKFPMKSKRMHSKLIQKLVLSAFSILKTSGPAAT